MDLIGFVILVLLVLVLLPIWPYSKRWGYAPSTLAGLLLVILILYLLLRPAVI